MKQALLCVRIFLRKSNKIERPETYLLRVWSSRTLQEGMSKAEEQQKPSGNSSGNDRVLPTPPKCMRWEHAETNPDSNVVDSNVPSQQPLCFYII
ncbi:hypothetical protein Tco_0390919 [Tanacetum coccineum]